ncbi:YceD family protein [Piscinibacter defluvii]|uniref:YceD family protein n=1 Tax=Piscinibacter defluvii TaxID=1796922 RepID=UPI000FDD1741|nr:YceD family protein [Piscinibacter defluvii]
MKARALDPLHLDVAAFAEQAAQLQGCWPLRELERLAASAHADCPPGDTPVDWQARGEQRAVRGGAPQVWLHLQARTALQVVCQRCLGPLPVDVRAERSFLFVPGEDQAAELDADCEDDVLALTRSLDLKELVEDELLLSLPLVPRHAACPLPAVAAEAEVLDERPNPFAALAALKGRPPRPDGSA